MSRSAVTRVPVKLVAGEKAITDMCMYPTPKPFVELAKLPGRWLVLEGTGDGAGRNQRRLVGMREVDDAADSSAVWVTPALLRTVAPDSQPGATVDGTVSPASAWEVFTLMGFAGIGKALAATLVFAAAVTGAVASFVSSKTGIGIAALILAIIVGLIGWKSAIRDTFTPNCSPGN